MKVLAVCPMPRLRQHSILFPRAMQSILSQDVPFQVDYLMQSGDNLRGNRLDRVAWKYEQARFAALEWSYDYMWCVEYDMIVPEDALSKLMAIDSDIAYGLYCWRHAPWLWNAHLELDAYGGKSLSEDPVLADLVWGKTLDVAGAGQGCTLISNAALKKITFHRAGPATQDWYLAIDAQRLGLTQRCDTSVVCGHMGLTPRPTIVWPDPTVDGMARLENFDA